MSRGLDALASTRGADDGVGWAAVSIFEDHQPCPSLARWLPTIWNDKAVVSCVCGPSPSWRPPRSVRRLVASDAISALEDASTPSSADVLITLTALPGPILTPNDSRWMALRPGGLLIDLAVVQGRRATDMLRPWARAQRLQEAAANRMRDWMVLGGFDPEQWAPVAPSGLVLSMIRRAVVAGAPMPSDE